ncbi:MAG: uroporphyrinogen-III C-methyltransferase [Corynebacterium sp.]|uniref:uroporphyrinogen-III C-methyltransferase n=1 Tax=unclassified Corynebacterium TaxID=2624378 RepID=UPI00264AA416|nr:uroporphyrinogen-III C-methyltransferase [Corynebacterium sp.]MDN6258431.1 uroporphyrinogen-III C-methyltransferase [Corynebacterium sp.]MDN6324044.1 uroporphyrinogen-III C-methyltransferase [Corynebacterium sp.]MDN6386143.1 uroporphyrinogen-III C-methyltransferase [Corynebacterium sp.]
MTIVMTGLDVRDRLVVLVGGGTVTARRADRLIDEGAVLRIVAPRLSADTAAVIHKHATLDPGRVAWVARTFHPADLDDAWLVHTATGNPSADSAVVAACDERRIWCIDAGDALGGSARLCAVARHGDVAIGTVSTDGPDPRRSTEIRSAVQRQLDRGLLPTRRIRGRAGEEGYERGSVVLIGGGPGPGDLLTLRGYRALLQADVIIHDRLGPTDVLEDVGPDVEIIDVGKAPGRHRVPQEQINGLIIDRARRGLKVARLKGGDPFVFGRGGEEAQACTAAGIPVDVLPGVSSAVSAPAVAGVPVTHRGVADSLYVVNGHRRPRPATLAALQDDDTTVVVLMGVATLQEFSSDALASGVPRDRPVAIVENAHRTNQRVFRTTLANVTNTARTNSVANPAVIIVGETARAGLLTDDTTAVKASA